MAERRGESSEWSLHDPSTLAVTSNGGANVSGGAPSLHFTSMPRDTPLFSYRPLAAIASRVSCRTTFTPFLRIYPCDRLIAFSQRGDHVAQDQLAGYRHSFLFSASRAIAGSSRHASGARDRPVQRGDRSRQ